MSTKDMQKYLKKKIGNKDEVKVTDATAFFQPTKNQKKEKEQQDAFSRCHETLEGCEGWVCEVSDTCDGPQEGRDNDPQSLIAVHP